MLSEQHSNELDVPPHLLQQHRPDELVTEQHWTCSQLSMVFWRSSNSIVKCKPMAGQWWTLPTFFWWACTSSQSEPANKCHGRMRHYWHFACLLLMIGHWVTNFNTGKIVVQPKATFAPLTRGVEDKMKEMAGKWPRCCNHVLKMIVPNVNVTTMQEAI